MRKKILSCHSLKAPPSLLFFCTFFSFKRVPGVLFNAEKSNFLRCSILLILPFCRAVFLSRFFQTVFSPQPFCSPSFIYKSAVLDRRRNKRTRERPCGQTLYGFITFSLVWKESGFFLLGKSGTVCSSRVFCACCLCRFVRVQIHDDVGEW